MSLSQKTADYETTVERGDPGRSELGTGLALFCVALVLVIASVTFAPVSTANQTGGEVSLVGP
jgi:hypothetical protein